MADILTSTAPEQKTAPAHAGNSDLHVLNNLKPAEFFASIQAMENRAPGAKNNDSSKQTHDRSAQTKPEAETAGKLDFAKHDIYANSGAKSIKVAEPIQQQLRDDAAKLMGGKDSKQFMEFDADLTRFELTKDGLATRLKDDQKASGSSMTPEQARVEADKRISDSEKSIDHLLQAKDSTGVFDSASRYFSGTEVPMTLDQRIMLASSYINEVSHPLDAAQGTTSACAITSFDKILYSEHPEKVADILDKIGTTGTYSYQHFDQANNGWQETATMSDFTPNKKTNEGSFGNRTYADQILQNVVGEISANEFADNERLPRSTYQDGGAMSSSWYLNGADAVQKDIYRSITGDNREVAYNNYDADHPAESLKDWHDKVQNAEDNLAKLQKDGGFPITLGVHGWNASKGNMDGGHQILITGYNSDTKLLTIAGSEKEGPGHDGTNTLSVDQLVDRHYGALYNESYRMRDQPVYAGPNKPSIPAERITRLDGSVEVIKKPDPSLGPRRMTDTDVLEKWDSNGKLQYKVFPNGDVYGQL